MNSITIPFTFLWIACTAEEYYYNPYNVTRTTISGIAAYRSALTLDWLAAEDSRQRELASAFETEPAPPSRLLTTECIAYSRPSAGKVARLMVELLKNLEGDDAKLIPELVQVLIRNKLLVETASLDSEPDLDALVKTPGVMMGEPHVTFPRIIAMTWLTITDPATTKKYGWCPINKLNKYLSANKPALIAKHMRSLEPVVARARFIMEEFIQNITPLNIYQKKTTTTETTSVPPSRRIVTSGGQLLKTVRRPIRFPAAPAEEEADLLVPTTYENAKDPLPKAMDGTLNELVTTSSCEAPPLRPDDDSDEFSPGEDRWVYRHKKVDAMEASCSHLRPSAKDIVRRYYAILPYFDKEHSNTAFLHKLRGTIYGMSEGEDVLDKEAAFYATVLTPVIFLQQYRDTWCLLERFHRAIRLYQISHPTEKRSALKILQNLRSVTQKTRTFVYDLPGPSTPSRTTTFSDVEEEDLHDKRDIKYVSELIKNLG